jgi:ribosome maturation factor RimP
MEEDNLIEGAHTLEVSSPGVDHPLKFSRQYPQHIGRNLHVLLKDGKEFEGKLLSAEEEKIAVEAKIKVKGKKPFIEEKTFELEEIKEAKIKIVF